MNEIKCRVWDKYCEKMIYPDEDSGLYLKLNGNVVSPTSALKTDGTLVPTGQMADMTKDYIVMQFTGLKDKNGKEIYAGDILHWKRGIYTLKENGSTSVVEFNNGEFICRCNWRKSDYLKKCEIIGNIYGDQELLEGKNE